jgi:protein SCO1
MKKFAPTQKMALLSLGIVLMSGLVFVGCQPASRATSQSFDPYPVPAFSLIERSGKTITNEDMKGTTWIAAFIFTRCNGPCPTVSATMAKLQNDLLPKSPKLKLVTFTVDPERDTPDELKKYATNFRADPDRWLFLTGPEGTVRTLLMDGFKINATKKANPKPGDEIDHNTKLLVINSDAQICGLFDGMKSDWDTDGSLFADNLKKLSTMVDSLAK